MYMKHLQAMILVVTEVGVLQKPGLLELYMQSERRQRKTLASKHCTG